MGVVGGGGAASSYATVHDARSVYNQSALEVCCIYKDMAAIHSDVLSRL